MGAPPSAAPVNSGPIVHPGLPARALVPSKSQHAQAPGKAAFRPDQALGLCLGSCARESGLCLFLLNSQSLTPAQTDPGGWGPVSMGPEKREKLSTEHRLAPGTWRPGQPGFCLQHSTPPPHTYTFRGKEREKPGCVGWRGEGERITEIPSLPLWLPTRWSELSLRT